jgi:hypothetical protein
MTMRTLALALWLLATTEVHADDHVDVALAAPIATAPDRGIDPDLEERMSSASVLVERGKLAEALDAVLVPFQSPDPFSKAQGKAVAPAAVDVMTRVGQRARAGGDVVLAARAFDARWALTGGKDPDLARALVDWSEHAPRDQAIYLARRARRADPDLTEAVARDDDLSTNHLVWPGRLMALTGAIAFAAGVYAQETGRQGLATGLYIASPALAIGGCVVIATGAPEGKPMSPGELPVLPER